LAFISEKRWLSKSSRLPYWYHPNGCSHLFCILKEGVLGYPPFSPSPFSPFPGSKRLGNSGIAA
jgi:hypothetical protein